MSEVWDLQQMCHAGWLTCAAQWPQCVAGEPATFAIQARDRHGHAVRGGAAGFAVDVTAGAEHVTGAAPPSPPVSFSETGSPHPHALPCMLPAYLRSGDEVQLFTGALHHLPYPYPNLTLAGMLPCAQAPSQTRAAGASRSPTPSRLRGRSSLLPAWRATPPRAQFEARCEAAAASLAHCAVASVEEAIVAGQPGVLAFWQADRCALPYGSGPAGPAFTYKHGRLACLGIAGIQ